MKVSTIILTIQSIITILLYQGSLGSKTEEKLISDLFSNYNSAARPVLFDSQSVNLTFGLTLSQIIDVHEKMQILVISAWIRQLWNNPLLSWDPKKYNGIKGINVKPSRVWLPDIVLYSNADEDKTFGGNLDRLNTRVIIDYDGNQTWLAPIILKSKCDIDVTYFPFDIQRCPLKFGSWTYDRKRLNLQRQSATADTGKYSNNSEWELRGVPAALNEQKYYCCPETFQDITYTVVIARRSLFYLCNLIFPMTMIGMLTILSFLLPAESGERVSLAITLLLAMTVFMLVVADIIPATSDVVPLVGIFFSASMVEMVVMIIVLCYVLRLYHKTPNDPPMPYWMRRFVLDWLSYKVGVRHKTEDEEREETLTGGRNFPTDSMGGKAQLLKQEFSAHNGLSRSELRWENEKVRSSLYDSSRVAKETAKGASVRGGGGESEAAQLIAKVELICAKLRSMDEDDEVQVEWRIVAMTIDNILLMLFSAILVFTLLGCFMKAPGYVG